MTGREGTTEREVVVIGAGPAGSIAARQLALLGHDVLLVEASTFPRWKVCGCCLGPRGGRALDDIGLGGLLSTIGADKISSTNVLWRGRKRSFLSKGMYSVSRASLDSSLVKSAAEAGAEIAFDTRAKVVCAGNHDNHANVAIRTDGKLVTLRAQVVVLAAGLRSSHTDVPVRTRTSPRSYIGLGAIGSRRPDWLMTGELSMFLGDDGYAGCVLTEYEQITWGAAVAPGAIRAAGSPGACVARILTQAGVEHESISGATWVGTPRLTQTNEAQTGRVYRVGDAAGYVEPITGEGMSWAIASGARSAAVIHSALLDTTAHSPLEWPRQCKALLRGSMLRSGLVARAVRSPAVLYAGLSLAGVSSSIGSRALSRAIGSTGSKEGEA